MDESDREPTPSNPTPEGGQASQNLTETSAPDHQAQAQAEQYGLDDAQILKDASRRFKQALDAVREDFDECEDIQDFISGDQWPVTIKSDREKLGRPCLTLDHLNQYVRHVVNSGLQRRADIRVIPLNDQGDDEVAEILAGMERQIVQTSTAKVAYETGLRHSCQNGFGYWRVKAVPSGCTHPVEGTPLLEIAVRRIADPRMVLFDPFCEYPDGRDGRYCFVLTKMATEDYKDQYNQEEAPQSWHLLEGKETMSWASVDEHSCVIAEYYYKMADGTLCWAVLSPNKVLAKGIHHGDLLPVLRCVGEEYEKDGKQRRRGMYSPAMDSQRAYNYSVSAFMENCALAPIAPFVAADGQIEQYAEEWKDAHKVPRSVLRYKPVSVGGMQVPPPQRSIPAGIPEGWQGMMQNLIMDTQMTMGLAQPTVLGTGGGSPQTGAAMAEMKAPGDTNTFHFHEHWYQAIEQTGRVIMAMIPTVYTLPQAVKIVGDDGAMRTALINPGQEQAVTEAKIEGYEKVLGKSYNPCLGKYDVVITLGPSSASKRQETNKMLMTMVNANPQLLSLVGDLLVGSMDLPNADVIAKRMSGAMPSPEQMKELQVKLQTMTAQLQEAEQLILAEKQKAEATIAKGQMDNKTELMKAQIKSQTDLEMNAYDNIVKLMVERMKAKVTIDVTIMKQLSESAKKDTHEDRMGGYLDILDQMSKDGWQPEGAEPPAPPPPPPQQPPVSLTINQAKPGKRSVVPRQGGGYDIIEHEEHVV